MILDRDWKIHYWNETATAITALPCAEALGVSICSHYPPAENELFYQHCQAAFETGQPRHFDHFHPVHQVWLEVFIHPGNQQLTIYFRDISERKEKETRIREINERHELLARATSEAIWDWKIGEQQFLWYGDNFKKLFGYNIVNDYGSAELWESNIHPDQREEVVKKLWSILHHGGDYWSDEYWFRKADGTYAFVKDRAFILRHENGKPQRMIGSMDDITVQKKAQEALKDSETNYRSLFEHAPVPKCIYDENSLRILEVNGALLTEFGYSREELLETLVPDLSPDPILGRFVTYLRRKQAGRAIPMGIWKHRNSRGERFIVEVYANKIQYKGKACVLVDLHNITHQVKLETKLLKLQGLHQQRISRAMIQGEEKQREAIGRELHDNINQMIASSKLLLESALENEDTATELIRLSRDTIQQAMNDIRKLSRRLMPSALKYAGLQDSVKDLLNPYRAAKAFDIHFRMEGNEADLSAPLTLTLFRIIQEQMNNIQKYANARNVWIQISIEAQVELLIRDDGAGFNTCAKRTGVGITNMQNRTHLHNGRFTLTSGPGIGCELLVQIPNKRMARVSTDHH